MSVQNEICTYEQARKIMLIGVERKTSWYWVTLKNGDRRICAARDLARAKGQIIEAYPAYSAAELLEMLPDQVCIYKDKAEYCASVHKLRFPLPDMGESEFFIIKSGVSVSNALAAMYVYLKGHQLA